MNSLFDKFRSLFIKQMLSSGLVLQGSVTRFAEALCRQVKHLPLQQIIALRSPIFWAAFHSETLRRRVS
jgi:chorismate-pyruvate lyase